MFNPHFIFLDLSSHHLLRISLLGVIIWDREADGLDMRVFEADSTDKADCL